MPDRITDAASQLAAEDIFYLKNEELRRHTSFHIGGPAALFCAPRSEQQVSAAIAVAKGLFLPYYFIGKGSNVLFCDEGFEGVVIHLGGICEVAVEGDAIVAGAGADLAEVCLCAARAGLSGLEFAYGIPGSVGGAVCMNAGAFDGEICQALQSVVCLNENQKPVVLPEKELEMEYRTSVFQRKPWCILSARFLLRRGDAAAVLRTMEEHMACRRQKQPLDIPSAGSAFKRPPGAFAAALIDESGLRGFRMGDAAISEKHCGFIVNHGAATCRDVLRLADEVARIVRKKTGYSLEREIRVIGAGR